MSGVALSPVSVAIYAKLNVSALKPGTWALSGIHEGIVPQGAAFPYVWYSVSEDNARGLGRGGLRQVNLTVHAASTYQGDKQLQQIIGKVVDLLEDAALVIVGYRQGGEVVYHEAVGPFDSTIGGVRCREMVANFTIWAEPA
jgi:hypothetical protein